MDTFILMLLKKRDKLKVTTLYNILIGKKTSSILTYAYFNQLLPYLGLFKELEKEAFLTQLKKFQKNQLLIIKSDWITANEKLKEMVLPKEHWTALNPLLFNGTSEEEWSLFLFAVQVISQKAHDNKVYEPLLDSYFKQQEIKKWLKENHIHTKASYESFYEELKSIFSNLPNDVSNRLSVQLHGYKVAGLVPQQVYNRAYPFNYLDYLNDLHSFFEGVMVCAAPVLQSLLKKPVNSLRKTESYVKEGLGFNELVRARQDLKESTIRDHLIEIAIKHPKEFPFNRYIDEEIYQMGRKEKGENYQDWQFEKFSQEGFDFLSFRLLQILVQEDPNVLRK